MNPLLAALVAAGVITQDEAERINRQQDPDAARLWAEQQLAAATQGGLSAQQARLADLLRTTGGNPSAAALDAFWTAEDARLWESMRPALEQVAAENAVGAAVSMGAGDAMWNTVNQRVIDWTAGYYTSADPAFVGSIPNLNQTARQQVADAFTRWNRGELNDGRRGGLPALITELEAGGTFSPARASRIAITETTRIFSEAEAAAADAVPELDGKRWDTARDEIVCKICAPLDRRIVGKNEAFAAGIVLPPAHPNCRCGVTFVVMDKATEKPAPVAPKTAARVPEFKTVREAQDWALRELGLEVDYSAATINQATSINRAVFDVQQRYKGSKLVSRIEWVDDSKFVASAGDTIRINRAQFTNEVIQESNAPTLAVARTAQKRIDLLLQQIEDERPFLEPEQIAGLERKVNRLKESLVKAGSGRWTYGENMYDIMVHELGHNVRFDLTFNEVEGVTGFLNPAKMREKGMDFYAELASRIGSIAQREAHKISEYATTNDDEYFSEAFVAYIKNDHSIINPELLAIFKKVMP